MARPKKAESPKRRTSTKRVAPRNVEDYIATIPEDARESFLKLRAAIRSVLPADATEIISYGMPAFKRDKVLVWFAAFSDHCSLFPTAAVIDAFKDELKNFPTSKGTIHFPLDKPLPAALIKKIVKARVKQVNAAMSN